MNSLVLRITFYVFLFVHTAFPSLGTWVHATSAVWFSMQRTSRKTDDLDPWI
jgi:hypothetical protein